jgi:glycosyltransferase involved in cell wall biosynthesis
VKVSLIMPTIGRREDIYTLLDSLEMQTTCAFELIVVDQNQDGLLEPIICRLSSSAISYLHILTQIKGLSIARNIAFPFAQHDIIGYPDDDCSYEEDALAKVVEYFELNPEVDGLIGRWCEMDLQYDTEFFLDRKDWQRFKLGISAFSSCLFMKKELVKRVAGFDERLGVPLWFNAGEETDFIMRCLSSGARIRYVPSVRIHHPVKSILEGSLASVLTRVRSRSRGTGALYLKHRYSWVVISRGLLSPILKSLIPPYSLKRILANITTVLGRIEGMVRWNYITKRSK